MKNKGIFPINPAVFTSIPSPPVEYGFLLNYLGDFVLNDSGGFISTVRSTLNMEEENKNG